MKTSNSSILLSATTLHSYPNGKLRSSVFCVEHDLTSPVGETPVFTFYFCFDFFFFLFFFSRGGFLPPYHIQHSYGFCVRRGNVSPNLHL